jgi:hypothetical protein
LVLHRQFRELHERGEWFRLTDEHISADYEVPDAAGVVDSIPAERDRLRIPAERGRRMIGEKPLTNAEKQARHRERVKARLEAADEAVAFVLAMHPDHIPAHTLTALQRKLEKHR